MALQVALLLDVDGTLINLAARPELVIVGSEVRELLDRLHTRLEGALALVSGRSVDSLDRLFAPFRSAAAGLHGMELRDSSIAPIVVQAPVEFPPALLERVHVIVRFTPGAFIENKSACVAVHHRFGRYSVRPLRAALRLAVGAYGPDWNMIDGHQVIEIKPTAIHKGSACTQLMSRAPFRGRMPVYLGDDTTDIDAFVAIRELGGIAIAVGPRVAAHATLRLSSPSAARAWLTRLAVALHNGSSDVAHVLEKLGEGRT